MKVWIYYHGDHNIGGGGAIVEVYSSAELAMKNHPGDWKPNIESYYDDLNSLPCEPKMIYETEVDPEY